MNPLDLTDSFAKMVFQFLFLNALVFNRYTTRIFMCSTTMKLLVIFGVYRWQDLSWLHHPLIHRRMFWELDYRDSQQRKSEK